MSTLIIVDVQNDFCPGGALPVQDGDAVVQPINQMQERFELVVACQDWHPANHKSFASQHKGKKVFDVIKLKGIDQVLWPDHCVQNTKGAEFHPDLNTERITRVFQKATDPEIDTYSAFYDNNHLRSTGLAEFLRERGIKEVTIVGLATDYCVKFSALDAVKEGFKANVIKDATRGIGMNEGDIERAFSEMSSAGVTLL